MSDPKPNSENSKSSLDKIQQPSTSGVRLQTFNKRDLTLGTNYLVGKLGKLNEPKNKKVFIPNLNVQRNKNKSEVNLKEKKPKKDTVGNKSKSENRHRNRNLIQEKGVFADGLASNKIKRPSLVSNERTAATPRIENIKIEDLGNENDEDVIQKVIGEDSLNNDPLDPNTKSVFKTLPFLPLIREKLDDMKIENDSFENKLKNKATNSLDIKIKKEVEDNSYGDVKMPMNIKIKTEPLDETDIKTDVISNKVMKEKEPFLMQLPDTFHHLEEGHIGDLRIYKSGRVSMKLGNIEMNLKKGQPLRTNMEIMKAQLNKNNLTGEMMCLGQIHERILGYIDTSTVFPNS